ncbi:hypothetical protein OG898_19120 [Streptomyces sp. NBC_00193]|uniref:hypothetical protein n=1 Tax=unclassified Streptomyces TaxID=2593676 RepID=UPI002251F301|nr:MULTISPECIES: hypothetical protein [unclassified Streptomyces]MCX5125626.1 hypothetical protein [Streptomyces sp. NBC_00347]MCX5298568.1 hypothetical protein [Streptomyces sp. NBC_00193]
MTDTSPQGRPQQVPPQRGRRTALSGPDALAELRVRRLNRWQAERLKEDVADLYVESSYPVIGTAHSCREAFLHRFAGDVRRPGFAMLVAERPALFGCIFGFPLRRDGSWWRGFLGTLPRDVERLTASGHVFAVSEVVVAPHAQCRTVGRRLQERLLDDHGASLGATLVPDSDIRTLKAFQSWGWREIGEVHRPPGTELVKALVLPLGPTAGTTTGTHRPGGLRRPER